MAEKIDYTLYNQVMDELAADFQEALKKSLAEPYPYAPGFGGNRPAFGVRNMRKQTGALYNSIKVKWDEEQDQIIVSMLDYWRFVNDGRRPGKYVPIKPLMRWIRAKGWNKSKETGKFKKFSIKGAAFGVSTNIFKFGIQPTYFYDKAFDQFEKSFEKEAVKALGIDITNFFEKVLEQDIIK